MLNLINARAYVHILNPREECTPRHTSMAHSSILNFQAYVTGESQCALMETHYVD